MEQPSKFKDAGHSIGKSISIDLQATENMVRLSGASLAAVEAELDGKPVFVTQAGNFNLKGLRLPQGTLILTSKKEIDLNFWVTEYRRKEYIDDREVPEPKPSMNVLAQMRNEFRRQMGVIREPFDSDAPWPGHEIDDEAPMMFEEEQAAAEAKARKDAEKEQANEKANAQPPEETQGESTT